MSNQVNCPTCGTQYRNVRPEHLGKTARCKKCGSKFLVRVSEDLPAPEQTPATVKAEPDAEPTLNLSRVVSAPPFLVPELPEKPSIAAPEHTTEEGAASFHSCGHLSTEKAAQPQATILARNEEPADRHQLPSPTIAQIPPTVVRQPPGVSPDDATRPAAPKGSHHTVLQTRVQPVQTIYARQFADPPGLDRMERDVPLDWAVGDVIMGLYEVTGLLGEGGMGRVYKVRHRGWNVDLAVKSPKAEFIAAAGGVDDFVREAETWVNLGLHPNVVTCHYVRTLGGVPRLFAEHIEGGSLSDWIQNRNLYKGDRDDALARILDVAIQSAWGLHYAHEQGLVHQDMKPANVMMASAGAAKITDFGLTRAKGLSGATLYGPKAGHTMVVAGAGAYTPQYASHEQLRGFPLTRRTDMFCWAVSVVEMFSAGVLWTMGAAVPEFLDQFVQDWSSTEVAPLPPDQVVELLHRCLRSDPSKRPESMKYVAAELVDTYRDVTGRQYQRKEPKSSALTSDTLNNQALSLLDLGKMDAALALWEEALRIQPHHPEATYNQGLIRWRSAETQDLHFLKGLEEMAQSHSEDWKARYSLALALMEKGEYRQAGVALKGVKKSDIERNELLDAQAVIKENLRRSPGMLFRATESSHPIVPCCLSADGRHALTVGMETYGTLERFQDEPGYQLHVRQMSTGKIFHTINAYTNNLSCVCISPNGRYMLAGTRDCELKAWDLAEPLCPRLLLGHAGPIGCVSLSHDGKYGLSGCDDGTIRLWNLETGECLSVMGAHKGRVSCVLMDGDGEFAVSSGQDEELRLWDLKTSAAMRTSPTRGEHVTALGMSADGKQVAYGTNRGSLRIWETGAGQLLRSFDGHADRVTSVCLEYQGLYMLSGSLDNSMKIWELATGRCLRTTRYQSGIVGISLSYNGSRAIVTLKDGTIEGWTSLCDGLGYAAPLMISEFLSTDRALKHSAQFESLVKSAEDALLSGTPIEALQLLRMARSLEGYHRHPAATRVWNKLSRRLPRAALDGGWNSLSLEEHNAKVLHVAVSRDGQSAVSADIDNTLKFWNLETGACLATIRINLQGLRFIALSDDSRFVMVSLDSAVEVWSLADRACFASSNPSEGRRHFLLVQDLEEVSSWYRAYGEAALGRSVARLHSAGNLEEVMAKKGAFRLHVIGNSMELHGSASDGPLCAFGHASPPTVTASYDGRMLAVARGNYVETSTIQSGTPQVVLSPHAAEVTCVTTTFDGSFVLSGCADGTLKMWGVATNVCVRDFPGHKGAVTCAAVTIDGRYLLSGGSDTTLRLWSTRSGRCLRVFEGHTAPITSIDLSLDGLTLASGSADKAVKVWVMDWELGDRPFAEWDDEAAPYLRTFLSRHRRPPETHETAFANGKLDLLRGKRVAAMPPWTRADLRKLMDILGCAGYGWLRRSGVERKLMEMAPDLMEPTSTASEEPFAAHSVSDLSIGGVFSGMGKQVALAALTIAFIAFMVVPAVRYALTRVERQPARETTDASAERHGGRDRGKSKQSSRGDLNGRLLQACAQGDATQVQELLNKGADMNSKGNEAASALMIACSKGHLEVAELLLTRGANPNLANIDRSTPLMIAAWNRNAAIVELLLSFKRTDPHLRDVLNNTALDYAIRTGDAKIQSILIDYGSRR